ncbi:carboxypeptidase Q-like [Chelonus insularis]|uniref:carboxypeptidase Q-like n=1 Tax=Chelonus insularis TaxID=460826 RepID=UPI00158F1A94|nr:carboxypeptidase Q-like [Chelonus insularis]
MLYIIIPILFFSCQYLVKCDTDLNNANIEDSCNQVLSSQMVEEIDNYAHIVNNIINVAINGSFKGKTWDELDKFIVEFGARFTGTENLERSIDYVLQRSEELGLHNVHGEKVKVPRWIRGQETATLLSPWKKDIKILGLGYSVSTPPEGIIAEAIIVKTLEELKARSSEVSGKIVIYNQEYLSFEYSSEYSWVGATEAAKFGAVATLIRSVTPFSIYTPHAFIIGYNDSIPKIPAASITVEDVNLLSRMVARGKNITIKLVMQEQRLPDIESRNVVAEIAGTSRPNKVVVVSGHIDSWDVGQGAMDDGGGAFAAWNSLVLLKTLNLQPKRTIRAIMWTGHEMGIIGAENYIKEHKSEENDLQLVMESDTGTFLPLGWEVTGSPEVICVLKRITKLMSSMTPLGVRSPFVAPDIWNWVQAGVPGASLWNQNERYIWFHHSEGDTMDVEKPENLDMATALFAATAYIVADMSLDLPHSKT